MTFMNDGLFTIPGNLGSSFKSLAEAGQKATSELLALQMRSLSRVSEQASKQSRELFTLINAEGLDEFVSSQAAAVREFQGGMLEDMKETLEIGTRLRDQVATAIRQAFEVAPETEEEEASA